MIARSILFTHSYYTTADIAHIYLCIHTYLAAKYLKQFTYSLTKGKPSWKAVKPARFTITITRPIFKVSTTGERKSDRLLRFCHVTSRIPTKCEWRKVAVTNHFALF